LIEVETIAMRLPRASGILLHPTSLPGRFGIGDIGPAAERFIALLCEAGQRWWQILPLGPTGFGNSPYQSHSSFAGNRLLISPERLVADGWLDESDLDDYPELPGDHVDYDAVYPAKDRLFRRAYDRLTPADPAFDPFCKANAGWLDDYALYMALKLVHGGVAWNDWEPEIASRQPDALARWRAELAPEVRFVQFVQYLFFRQWEHLRERLRHCKVGLIGDLPIFVAQDSADVWARPDLFQLDEKGRPTVVAGVPPDYFSATGQLWGNPLYKWPAHAVENYAWWIGRLKATTDRVDLVRLDHFRGFEAYWEVPAGAETAVGGRWVPGPADRFLNAVRDGLGALPLIAEDLGEITPGVESLRDHFQLPGMRILQFAFGDDVKANDYLPYNYIHHCCVYTGTHDNDTTVGWFHGSEGMTTQSEEVKKAEQSFVQRYVGTDCHEVHWDLIRLALGSVADTAIIPLQDLLGLDSVARMNIPGRGEGNWRWRFHFEQLDPLMVERLADLTAVYHRWNGEVPARFHHFPVAQVRPEEPVGTTSEARSVAGPPDRAG
jgi:4-alpha-glucanotransferase